MSKEKSQGFLKGTLILSVSTIIVKLVGLLFSIPIVNIIGLESMGYFNAAYDVFAVFNAAATSGLPVAIAKMISNSYALEQKKQAGQTFRVALTFFSFFGLLFSLAMFLFADRFGFVSDTLAGAGYAIRALSPTVFFCCVMSVYRGYFQGRNNMLPTALSQTLESVIKLLAGVSLASYIHHSFSNPQYSAAAAILGVSLSAGVGMLYLIFAKFRQNRKDTRDTGETNEKPKSNRSLLFGLLRLALPITAGACILQGLNLFDTAIITERLEAIAPITGQNASTQYGIWGAAVKIFDLPGALIIALSTSIIPVLASAYAKQDHRALRRNASAALRITFMIAIPCAIGFILYATPVASLFYFNRAEEAEQIGGVLRMLAIGVIFNGTLYTTNSIMQSLGHPTIPVINMTIGGIARILLNYTLVGNPQIGLTGAAYSSVISYAVIMVLNFIALYRLIPRLDGLLSIILPILLSSLGMGGISYLAYKGLCIFLSAKIAVIPTIIIAVFVYFVLAIFVRAIRPSDLRMLPKGETLVKRLHLYEGTHFE